MKHWLSIYALLLTFGLNAQIINTCAGNGHYGYSGNGGAATNAKLKFPWDVATDATGNIYIADGDANVIRKVNSAGIITTYAGNGTQGYSGDGGMATNASLSDPIGVATDNYGNLYIAEYDNHVIRKVNSNGIISTIAGIGVPGNSGNGGLAISAKLYWPYDVAIDVYNNLYISDQGSNSIKKVNANGIISIITGGNTISGYSGDNGLAIHATIATPNGITTDTTGNIYFCDYGNTVVRMINTLGIITTVIGNGTYGYSGDGLPAINAQLKYPGSVCADMYGNLYVADNGCNVIRQVRPDGIINTIVGNGSSGFSGDGGPPLNAQLNNPYGIAIDKNEKLYITDNKNFRIRTVDLPMPITTSNNNNNNNTPSVLSIPNIFTPNADGINDSWQIVTSGYQNLISNYQCTIYDRWGIKMFETNNPAQSWDGHTMSGLTCSAGTYYYLIRFTATNTKGISEQKNFKSFLELVR